MRITGGQRVNHKIAVPPGGCAHAGQGAAGYLQQFGLWIEGSGFELFAGSGALCLNASVAARSPWWRWRKLKHAVHTSQYQSLACIDVRVQCALLAVNNWSKRSDSLISFADPPYGDKTAPGQ